MFDLPYHLILASGSPRRKEILALMGFTFEVRVKDIDESYSDDLPPKAVPEFLALLKAKAYLNELRPDDLLITADTIVCKDHRIVGKPAHKQQAIEMLQELSGSVHTVVTGVCLTTLSRQVSFSCKSKVHLRALGQAEIEYYIDKFQPFDKAGGYGVQDWIGAVAISKIKGSYYNVMGLPSDMLYQELKNFALR
jgi:septum formation protein